MATSATINNISDFQIITDDADIEQLAIVYEPATSPPYVAVYLEVDSRGSDIFNTNAGGLRVIAHYTDGSQETLTEDNAPFSRATIENTGSWLVVKLDGKLGLFGTSPPTNSTSPNSSSTRSNGERLSLSASKTFRRVEVQWAENI